MNEKAPQDFSTSKNRLKHFSGVIPIGFELDLKTTSTHVSSMDEIDHALKKYPLDAEHWVEGAIIRAFDDFHVSNKNINFALVEEVDVKANQTLSASYSFVQQISAIHGLSYVSRKHHGDYVLEIKMGIKQDRTPSKPLKPLEPNHVGISPPKETIHGSISWSNAFVDKNVTIDSKMNAMMSIEIVFHILQ